MKLDELKKRYETSQAEHNHNYRAMLMKKIAMEAIRLAEAYREVAIRSRGGLPTVPIKEDYEYFRQIVDSEAEKLMETPK